MGYTVDSSEDSIDGHNSRNEESYNEKKIPFPALGEASGNCADMVSVVEADVELPAFALQPAAFFVDDVLARKLEKSDSCKKLSKK